MRDSTERKGLAVYTRAAGKRKESEGRRYRKEKKGGKGMKVNGNEKKITKMCFVDLQYVFELK